MTGASDAPPDGSGGFGSSEYFLRRFERDLAFAETKLREDGSLTPIMVVYPRAADPFPILTLWRNEEEKAGVFEFVRLVCLAYDALAVAALGEVWMVLDPETWSLRPSKSDRREEAVLVSLMGKTLAGERFSHVSVRRIERNAAAGVSGLSPVPVPPNFHARPAFGEPFDLLPKERPSGEAQAEARAALAAFERLGTGAGGSESEAPADLAPALALLRRQGRR